MKVVFLESFLVLSDDLQRVMLGLLALIFKGRLAELDADDFFARFLLVFLQFFQLFGADSCQTKLYRLYYCKLLPVVKSNSPFTCHVMQIAMLDVFHEWCNADQRYFVVFSHSYPWCLYLVRRRKDWIIRENTG